MSAGMAASPQNRPRRPSSRPAGGLSPGETDRMIEQLDALGVLMGKARTGGQQRDLRPGHGGRADAHHRPVRRPCAADRRPGPRQKPAGRDHGRRARPGHQARAVHARPDARRHHRRRGAGRNRRPPLVPFRPRPGVLPVADGRRDQPRQPAHPVRAAAIDAGAAGRDRRRSSIGCRARSTSWRRRTRSSRRAPIRCRKPSWTGFCWRSTSPIRRSTPNAPCWSPPPAPMLRAPTGHDARAVDRSADA